MAKKGQQSQLQVEVNNDEDWEKLLTREGLIIVDVYSEWCGPCAAMQANLRKLKLEIGGDFMHLALAKAGGVTPLKRFQNKSEPTWMFIAAGQQVNLIFGANAPILQAVILDELKKEKQCLEGVRTRIVKSPEALSEEEQAVVNEQERKEAIKEQLFLEKVLKQEREFKLAQSKNILTTYAPTGLIVVFPHAFFRAKEVVENALGEYGLAVGKREKPIFTEEMLDDIEYFASFKVPEQSRPFLCNEERCMAYTITLMEGTPGPIEDAVLSFVYGSSRCPPGDPDSPAQILLKSRKPVKKSMFVEEPPAAPPAEEVADEEDEEEEGEGEGEEGEAAAGEVAFDEGIVMDEVINLPDLQGLIDTEIVEEEAQPEEELEDIMGVWAPSNELVKGTALMYVLRNIMQQFILPEPEAPPPHVAVAFDAFKRDEVMKLVKEYPEDVMAYGFFTDQNPDTAKLIAKTPRLFEKTAATTTYGEKMVLKVSKKRSDPLLAFAQLGPTYISGNVNEGETECAIFFPEDYNEAIEEEEQPKAKDEPKRKRSKSKNVEFAETSEAEIVFEEGVIGEMPEGEGERPPTEEGGAEAMGEFEDVGQGEVAPSGEAGETGGAGAAGEAAQAGEAPQTGDAGPAGEAAQAGEAGDAGEVRDVGEREEPVMTELPPVEEEGLQEPAGEDRATSPMDAPPPE